MVNDPRIDLIKSQIAVCKNAKEYISIIGKQKIRQKNENRTCKQFT